MQVLRCLLPGPRSGLQQESRDQGVAIVGIREPNIGQRTAWQEFRRRGQPGIERSWSPHESTCTHGSRVRESACCASLATEETVQVRSDQTRSARLQRMAATTLHAESRSVIEIGRGIDLERPIVVKRLSSSDNTVCSPSVVAVSGRVSDPSCGRPPLPGVFPLPVLSHAMSAIETSIAAIDISRCMLQSISPTSTSAARRSYPGIRTASTEFADDAIDGSACAGFRSD